MHYWLLLRKPDGTRTLLASGSKDACRLTAKSAIRQHRDIYGCPVTEIKPDEEWDLHPCPIGGPDSSLTGRLSIIPAAPNGN